MYHRAFFYVLISAMLATGTVVCGQQQDGFRTDVSSIGDYRNLLWYENDLLDIDIIVESSAGNEELPVPDIFGSLTLPFRSGEIRLRGGSVAEGENLLIQRNPFVSDAVTAGHGADLVDGLTWSRSVYADGISLSWAGQYGHLQFPLPQHYSFALSRLSAPEKNDRSLSSADLVISSHRDNTSIGLSLRGALLQGDSEDLAEIEQVFGASDEQGVLRVPGDGQPLLLTISSGYSENGNFTTNSGAVFEEHAAIDVGLSAGYFRIGNKIYRPVFSLYESRWFRMRYALDLQTGLSVLPGLSVSMDWRFASTPPATWSWSDFEPALPPEAGEVTGVNSLHAGAAFLGPSNISLGLDMQREMGNSPIYALKLVGDRQLSGCKGEIDLSWEGSAIAQHSDLKGVIAVDGRLISTVLPNVRLQGDCRVNEAVWRLDGLSVQASWLVPLRQCEVDFGMGLSCDNMEDEVGDFQLVFLPSPYATALKTSAYLELLFPDSELRVHLEIQSAEELLLSHILYGYPPVHSDPPLFSISISR